MNHDSTAAPSRLCKWCSQPEHGSAACTTSATRTMLPVAQDPAIISYGVMYNGWMISFDSHKEANAFAAKHGQRVHFLCPAHQLAEFMAVERATKL